MSVTSTVRVPLPRAGLDRLIGSVRGRVILPGDGDYDQARTCYNAIVDNRPDAIVRVGGADDVQRVLLFARESGVDISVRGGAHGVVGHATAGQIVVDLSAMRQVSIDPGTSVVRAGGGCLWGDVDTAAEAYGLATPGGRVTHTGIAGLTLGGGQGWLSPLHGLSCDNLVAAQVVTADGRLLSVDADNEPDLFWALRGGGGNFGVVTEFTYQLHPMPAVILGGMLAFPLPLAEQVAATYAEIAEQGPREFGGALLFASAPDAPFVPPEAVGAPVVVAIVAFFGSVADGERLVAPLRALGPVVDMVEPMPYTALQASIDPMNPFGNRNYWSAAYVGELSPALVAETIEATLAKKSPLTGILVAQMGAAASEVPSGATAFPHREAQWLYHPMAVYTDAADDEVEKAWVRETMARVRPFTTGGTYLNTDSDQSAGRVREVFEPQTYARLQAAKTAYDPDNVFRHTAALV